MGIKKVVAVVALTAAAHYGNIAQASTVLLVRVTAIEVCCTATLLYSLISFNGEGGRISRGKGSRECDGVNVV